MTTKIKEKQNKTRFDARISHEQKSIFEKAAQLGGYRSLTDFVMHSAQNEAMKIIAENERILVSQQDTEIFFDSLMNPAKPNNVLTKAAKEYKKQFGA